MQLRRARGRIARPRGETLPPRELISRSRTSCRADKLRDILPQGNRRVDFGFTQEQQLLIERVNRLVKEKIAPRAAEYDESFEAPLADIQDLHREGWLLANLDGLAARRRD